MGVHESLKGVKEGGHKSVLAVNMNTAFKNCDKY